MSKDRVVDVASVKTRTAALEIDEAPALVDRVLN